MFEAEGVDSDKGRLDRVRERIQRAAERAGRNPDDVTLIAVSKTMPADRVLALAALGQRVFGENRVQEAVVKIPEVANAWTGPVLHWRMIGHLQRNKLRPALGVFETIDSVDSLRLLDALDGEADTLGHPLRVLLQFNCSGEASKGGLGSDDVPALVDRLRHLENVVPEGLMTIGPLAPDPEASRPAFRELAALRDRLEQGLGTGLKELSMGMSGDLEVGVEEGATLVRVGTSLFGERGGTY
ncbi:MAG TPA: YggS family pyridoxal phosphate-dependent enzyme [Dongiaceae bacterium]|jgi:pyridoxal phosphate enzyme (YggS family)|nr:YggS family pyridoxal phosphate-dependent enzyme [Dongiaceae bacterium]